MNASDAPALTLAASIDPREAAHFGRMAAEWWDPAGSSAMLHRLNPVRLRYIRDQAEAQWSLDRRARRPLAGLRVLDVGCGAGLLAEPLARLGGTVTAIDAAPENVAVAWLHAAAQGLAIDYRAVEAAALAGERFDLVTSLEVVEHVVDPAAFVATLGRLVAPGGLLILSTPNRTPLSRLALITAGEGLGMIPKGTHDWDKFLTPDQLTAHVGAAGFRVADVTGLKLSPTRGFVLSDDLALNYLITAVASGSPD